MGSYLESTDTKLGDQLENFSSKIGIYAATFGLTPTEVSSNQADTAFFRWSVSSHLKIETHKKDWTTFKNILKKGEANVTVNLTPVSPVLDAVPDDVAPGIVIRFTTMVNRIKAHQSYTTAIGQNLGVEQSGTAILTMDTAQPLLKAVTRGGKINLLWKKGKFSGILIEKDSGAGFVTHDKDFHPDFIDNAAMPAQGHSVIWKYKAIYLINDEKVGLWSNIVTVPVEG